MADDEDYKNGLVSYTSRDYESLKKEFYDLVPKLTDLWKPEADADPGVVLLKWGASLADLLGTNLDMAVTEMYAPTVSQRKNAEKLFALIGYDFGFYTCARTEITFTNNSDEPITLDFGYNGSNFSTLNAYTDITGQSRVITYNILPGTSSYGDAQSKSTRSVLTSTFDIFQENDKVTLNPVGQEGSSVTRVGIEGDLRSYSISVEDVKKNGYIISLPSQHIDTTSIWVKAKANQTADNYLETQWKQVASPVEFSEPEPRFAVTFDSYSNAQIQVSTYLNQLENYEGNWLTIYWFDCSGIIGCVGENVLSNLLFAKSDENANVDTTGGTLGITNLANTLELPHTFTVTGKSPETAHEAYKNSRNYINTWDSLVTLPDYTRFLKRESGVDNGIVIDCQKASEINLAIYNNKNLTDTQKKKMYITKYDFPEGNMPKNFDWGSALDLDFNPESPNKFVFSTNFKTYTAMCFAVHNDFKDSSFGQGQTARAKVKYATQFIRYKPPAQFINYVIKDFKPLQAMSVEMQFGYLRVFSFYVVGTLTPTKPVTQEVADSLIEEAKEALRLKFAPANFDIGQKPTLMDVVDAIETCDTRVKHFDPGAPKSTGIEWFNCDIEYFNPISCVRYIDVQGKYPTIRVNPDYIVES